MTPREEFLSLREGARECDLPIVVDIGTSSLTGVRETARPDWLRQALVAHPVMETLPLSGLDCAALGSDCVRTGLLFHRHQREEDLFVDAFGIEWLVVDGTPTPSRHPLENASLAQIAAYPRPVWPSKVQVPEPDADGLIVVADAPCPGLLDMCFGLRNSWVCLDDMTSNWRSISALLDWSLETIVSAYERMLAALQTPPDILVYGDDLGFQQSMFVSEIDFRNFIRPRMRTLLSRLRRLTPAPILFHSCGAIRPILRDIADLGVDLINFDGAARTMIATEIRRELPKRMIVHGSHDLIALGKAVGAGNMASVALLTTEIIDCMPVIAAPMDNITSAEDVEAARRGAEFLRLLSPDDVAAIGRFGPVKDIIEPCVAQARAIELPEISGAAPRYLAISQTRSNTHDRCRSTALQQRREAHH